MVEFDEINELVEIPEKVKFDEINGLWVRNDLIQAKDRLERVKKYARTCEIEKMLTMYEAFNDWIDKMGDNVAENLNRGHITIEEAEKLLIQILYYKKEKRKEIADILLSCVKKG